MSTGHSQRRRSSWLYRKLRRFKLVRIFKKDRPFLVVFCIGAVIALLVGIAVPKFWNTAPEDSPMGAIPVSLVDLAQARALRRSAESLMASSNWEESVVAWRSAVANNEGDARLHRGLLACLLAQTNAPVEQSGLAVTGVSWLLGLTATNAADLDLSLEVLEKFGQPRAALALVASRPAAEAARLARIHLRLLLAAGREPEFDAAWRAREAEWAADPVLKPYRDAWRMATDDTPAGLESALRLKKSLSAPGSEGLSAARLLHHAAARRGQADDMMLAVRRLELGRAATVWHYAPLWRLMAASGRRDEARAAAVRVRAVPVDAESAVRYVQILQELGLRDEAARFLEANLASYGTAPEVWRAYFELLAETGNWNEVRRVTANARMQASRGDALMAEAVFAEYGAAQSGDRRRDAGELAQQLLALSLAQPDIALRIAARWRADGRAGAALAILQAQEAALKDDPAYWSEFFLVGHAMRDVSLLRRAVAELVRIHPNSPVWQNNRAALLLVTGEAPAEALQLTLECLRRNPGSVGLRINHGIALLMNGRVAEAAAILDAVPIASLDPDAASSLHLAVAEIRAAEGRLTEAAAAAALVDADRLLPPQRERLERVRKPRPLPPGRQG